MESSLLLPASPLNMKRKTENKTPKKQRRKRVNMDDGSMDIMENKLLSPSKKLKIYDKSLQSIIFNNSNNDDSNIDMDYDFDNNTIDNIFNDNINIKNKNKNNNKTRSSSAKKHRNNSRHDPKCPGYNKKSYKSKLTCLCDDIYNERLFYLNSCVRVLKYKYNINNDILKENEYNITPLNKSIQNELNSLKNDDNNISKNTGYISSKPYKELDLKKFEFRNDYYFHILDWSSKNLIAFGAHDSVKILNPNMIDSDNKKFIHTFMTAKCFPTRIDAINDSFGVESTILSNNYKMILDHMICSIKFNPNGNSICMSDNYGFLCISDMNKLKNISYGYQPHKQNRICVMDYKNPNILIIGSKDHSISLNDLRIKCNKYKYYKTSKSIIKLISNNKVKEYGNIHSGEVCGLKFNKNNHLIISGENCNGIAIWDERNLKHALYGYFNHKAAVRALDFSPLNDNIFVTGGGSNDQSIRIWNLNNQYCTYGNKIYYNGQQTLKLRPLKKIDVGSQVCILMFYHVQLHQIQYMYY